MKKMFRLAALAITVVALTTACKSKAVEEPIDTTPIDTMPLIEEVIDTVEEVAEEVVAEPTKPVKKTVAKKETKPTLPNSERTKPSDQTNANVMQKAPTTDASKRGEVDKNKVMQKAGDKQLTQTSKK
ncbi:MAG: hypothetical protein K6E96_05225 [Bacteroidales bacterium]|nr:hypothetical protein [Bacteroidales bacterium]